MSENTEIRSALELLAAEPLTEQIDYYRKPFMVLWAAIQEAASDVAEDYDLPADMAQLWVAEQMRQVADSLVDRLAEKAVAHGASKSNVARAAGASPPMPPVASRRIWATMPPPRRASSLTTSSIPWNKPKSLRYPPKSTRKDAFSRFKAVV